MWKYAFCFSQIKCFIPRSVRRIKTHRPSPGRVLQGSFLNGFCFFTHTHTPAPACFLLFPPSVSWREQDHNSSSRCKSVFLISLWWHFNQSMFPFWFCFIKVVWKRGTKCPSVFPQLFDQMLHYFLKNMLFLCLAIHVLYMGRNRFSPKLTKKANSCLPF